MAVPPAREVAAAAYLPTNFRQTGISVLMPVHNAGDYLSIAIDSILNQTDVDLELLIIDDHSTDKAIGKLAHDNRLKLLKSPSKGIVPALNEGLKHAKGYWIARMDGDDIALPHRLVRQRDFLLKNHNIHICGAQVEIFKDSGDADQGYRHYQDWINAQQSCIEISNAFFVESCIPHPTAFMRKDHLLDLGGYHDSEWPEDYDLWCRAYIKGLKFAKPDGILLRWRDYQQRTSRQDERYAKQQFLKCKAHYLAQYLKNKNINECRIWGAGPTGLKFHDLLENEGISVIGFVDINPRLVGRKKRNKNVTVINSSPNERVLNKFRAMNIIAVSTRGARAQINDLLMSFGWQPHREFILAA